MNTLETFLKAHDNQEIVVVQGLGFVGAVMSLVVADASDGRFAVIGVDRDAKSGRRIVEAINNGEFPIKAVDPKIPELFERAKNRGNLFATVNADAYAAADVIIVDINLDVSKENDANNALATYNVDIEPFRAAMRTIGANCKQDALVLVETTVPPGTCATEVAPIIKQGLADRGLPIDQVRIGHSYERVMPGPQYVDSIQSFYRVYSGVDTESANAVESFLRAIIRTDEFPLTRLENTNATEIAKVLENSFRAMNIAFVVEWSRLAEEAGINLYEVVHAIRQRPTHANLMFPGIGVGGYCLTKDPLLGSWSRTNLIGGFDSLLLSETAVSINDQMPRYAVEFLKQKYKRTISGASVTLLGVTYRGDVGDTRFSPVEPFYRHLSEAGAQISTHDPFVEEWPELSIVPTKSLREAFKTGPDIVAITAGHSEYRSPETFEMLSSLPKTWIYDTIGLLTEPQIAHLKTRHTVIVLGRGDL